MPKSNTKKTLIITGIVVAAIALIAVGVMMYINHNAGKIADGMMRDAFAKSKLSKVYNLDYDN